MKRLISITIIFVAMVIVVKGQTINSATRTVRYGLEISHFSVGSGFAPGTELQFQLQSMKKRSIGLGIYFDNQYQRFSGITFNHKRILFAGHLHQKALFTPYMLYHFIFRSTSIPEVTANGDQNGTTVNYTSMEHHLGFGLRTRIARMFYLDSEIGYGLYLGSIKRPSSPDPVTHEITGTNGFGLLSKIGFGVNI